MLKNKFTYLVVFMLSLFVLSINNSSVLVHTGKSRIYQLVIILIIIIIGGILFVFVIDKVLSPKPKKKKTNTEGTNKNTEKIDTKDNKSDSLKNDTKDDKSVKKTKKDKSKKDKSKKNKK